MIDVHAHLLPGVDDGCQTIDESIECLKTMHALGYAYVACTPHVWPNHPWRTPDDLRYQVGTLQQHACERGVDVRLVVGAEYALDTDLTSRRKDELVTLGLGDEYLLFDFWGNEPHARLRATVDHLLALDITPVQAHPERIVCFQRDPELAWRFAERGVIFQGNLEPFQFPEATPERETAERFLAEGLYALLGSDTHGPATLPSRQRGLQRVRELVDATTFKRLTETRPRQVLGIDNASPDQPDNSASST